ncbi:MAG TPA: PAS domain-containing protein, partial [Methanomassiliicoccales archaeon]|nr:PAS domain-containing protein [Methanomassiliicoccales archaeon]
SRRRIIGPAALLDKMVEIQMNEIAMQDQDDLIKDAHSRLLEEMRRREMVEWSLLESENNYRNALNALADQVFVVDRELRVVIANDLFVDLLESYGLSEDFLGRQLSELMPHMSDEDHQEYEAVFRTGRTFVREREIETNGVPGTIEIRKVPIMVGGRADRVMTIIRGCHKRSSLGSISLASYDKLEKATDAEGRTEFKRPPTDPSISI